VYTHQESVVISLWKLIHLGIALIGARSQPTMSEPAGHTSEATCIHDPGAAHRSMTTLEFSRKLYFLLSCISLKAALARYPFSLARRYHLSSRPFPCFFWIAIAAVRRRRVVVCLRYRGVGWCRKIILPHLTACANSQPCRHRNQ
jgi:hypothetical protein